MTTGLEDRLKTIEYWENAEIDFKKAVGAIRNGTAPLTQKKATLTRFKNKYPDCKNYVRLLTEALELAELLAKYPQFDASTPRYYHGGKVFFMEIEPIFYRAQVIIGLNHYVKSAWYTDAQTGECYHLEGYTWEADNRIYTIAFLDDITVHRADYPLNVTVNSVRYTSSEQLIGMAFSSAETALFAKLQLIPF